MRYYAVAAMLVAALIPCGGSTQAIKTGTTKAEAKVESASAVKIIGPTVVPAHVLARFRAEGYDPKAALLWRVHPSKSVDRATTARHLLEFVANPGQYTVELVVISQDKDGALRVEEARVDVMLEGCAPVPPAPVPPDVAPPHPEPKPAPPAPQPKPELKPDPKTQGKLDPVNAIGRIRFGNAGCTATIIGPRRADGKWDVLTAAHCVNGVGAKGRMQLKDGRSFGLTIVVHQREPDLAWAITDESIGDLPYAELAEKSPPPGTKIWHMGYGVDRPGNREDGTVADWPNQRGQLRMILSVSSGDSGGGILRDDNNQVISTVCCTTGMAQKVSMFGASTELIRRARPGGRSEDFLEWEPLPIPIVPKELQLFGIRFPLIVGSSCKCGSNGKQCCCADCPCVAMPACPDGKCTPPVLIN